MSEATEVAAKPLPRRGRIWVVLLLALALFGLGYAIVSISTQKAGPALVHVEGIAEAQEIFGGVPQEGDRLGSSDAPVTIQVFNDLQCSSCRDAFLSTIPALTENYARPGSVKLLYRHYSNGETKLEKGFYGAEAAAEQGYGWQYIYLFFRNQEEAKNVSEARFEDFVSSMAGGVEELNAPEWEAAREEAEDDNEGAIEQRLNGYLELGENLGIRVGQAMLVTGPHGTRTLQDSPSLREAEAAIAAVE
jgi:thioredoxin family protein